MDIGVLHICNDECVTQNEVNRVAYLLRKYGYLVRRAVTECDVSRIQTSFEFLRGACEAILVCGNVEPFYNLLREKYELSPMLSTFMLDETKVATAATPNDAFVQNVLVPMLNDKGKTFYATAVFRTAGKTEADLRAVLKDKLKNRNRIVFSFVPGVYECTVLMRYSNKTQKDTVQQMIAEVSALLRDCTYAYEDIELSECVAKLLLAKQKTLGLCESFTGGGIASALVQYAGISQSLKEGIVCYSNEVKQKRLGVSPEVLATLGAVSDETAYEMAANLLVEGGYDCVVATTGNAGPTAEREGDVGVCFVAVGDRENVDIFGYKFDGDRQTVIASGIKAALFRLYQRLTAEA